MRVTADELYKAANAARNAELGIEVDDTPAKIMPWIVARYLVDLYDRAQVESHAHSVNREGTVEAKAVYHPSGKPTETTVTTLPMFGGEGDRDLEVMFATLLAKLEGVAAENAAYERAALGGQGGEK